MNGGAPIIIPNDEFLARPHIVAWLGYPNKESKRSLALRNIATWAQAASMGGISKPTHRHRLTETGLRNLDAMVDRQLLASEKFWRQVMAALPGDPWAALPTSMNSLANKAADHFATENGPQRENKVRDYWSQRRPVLHLGYGAILDWPGPKQEPRPTIRTLLFGQKSWALRCVREAGRMKLLAQHVSNRAADQLLDFRLEGEAPSELFNIRLPANF